MKGQYTFDDNYKIKKARTSVWVIIRKALLLLVASVSMAVLYYIIFALVFSTDEEKRLKQENKAYAEELPQLEEKERLLADVVEGLKLRDNRIYDEIFHASAPSVDPINSIDILTGLSTIPDNEIVRATENRLESLQSRAGSIEANFMEIARLLSCDTLVVPPMANPLKKFTFAQTGASTGVKVNPFYKVKLSHNGLDMIAPSGEPVYASAKGIVSDVTKSRKGLGNVVTIDHGNGIKTRYAHLADIEVRKGRAVKKGTRIGYVGVSGNSFAPHLHYEVLRDTVVLDPVNHLFASVGPEEYVNILIMSSMTGQSMD
jgi:murein DD-endopeptidase MepM/ murein hydrolase activator NlpD